MWTSEEVAGLVDAQQSLTDKKNGTGETQIGHTRVSVFKKKGMVPKTCTLLLAHASMNALTCRSKQVRQTDGEEQQGNKKEKNQLWNHVF